MSAEIWAAVIVAVIGSPALVMLTKQIIGWAKGKHKQEDDAWTQRDTQRSRADRLHEALNTHRTWCHRHHDAAYEEMPPFPCNA